MPLSNKGSGINPSICFNSLTLFITTNGGWAVKNKIKFELKENTILLRIHKPGETIISTESYYTHKPFKKIEENNANKFYKKDKKKDNLVE